MYSQNKEESYILQYFGEKIGTFLDLGAYDGIKLSNTRALAEKGWQGVCIEPQPEIFKTLQYNYLDNDKVKCYDYAVGTKGSKGTKDLYMNDTYYSTLIEKETERWEDNADITYVGFAKVEVLDMKNLLKVVEYKTFDFISIDCEGLDYEILTQLDLNKLNCNAICVEHNGINTDAFVNYIKTFAGFKLRYMNAENILMCRSSI